MNLKSILVIIAVALVVPTHLCSQRGTAAFGRGSGSPFWRVYGPQDGLAGDRALCVFQDRAGYIWFGTESGASRFDGHRFTNYTTSDGLIGDRVVAIAEDEEGRLWFGTHSGVSRLDGNRFSNYSKSDSHLGWGSQDRLAGDEVGFFYVDDSQRLWIGTSQGVSRYADEEFTTFTTEYGLVDDRVQCMAQDAQGHFWFGTGSGVSRYDGQLFHTFDREPSLAGHSIHFIHEDGQGHLWFGTSVGVTRLAGEEFTAYPLAGSAALCILESRDQGLWIGTDSGVIYRFRDPDWESFTPDEVDVSSAVAIYEDRAGGLWVGYARGGVSRYDGEDWTLYPTGWLRPGGEQMLEDRESILWLATADGVYRYHGHGWKTYGIADGLGDLDIRAITTSGDGGIWAATASGASRFDGTSWKSHIPMPGGFRAITRDGTGHIWVAGDAGACVHGEHGWRCFESDISGVTVVAGDSAGTVWLGTALGVSRFDGREWAPQERVGATGDGVTSLAAGPQGGVWAGTSAGLSRYEQGEWTRFASPEDLSFSDVVGVAVGAEQQLWVATAAGLSRFADGAWCAYRVADGLPQNRLTSVYVDRDGRAWCGTESSGATRFDGHVFQTLTSRDGLAGESVRGIVQGQAGDFWFATDRGVSRFTPAPSPPLPTIVLDAVIADRRYDRPRELALPSNLGVVDFEFHALSFKTRSESMLFRHRLRGHDPDWRTGRARAVRYVGLPEGNYTFEVQAVDRDLIYSVPATLALEIHPPRERLKWALALAACVLAVCAQTLRLVSRGRRAARQEEIALHEARARQLALMPEEDFEFAGIDLAARCLPARVSTGTMVAVCQSGHSVSVALICVGGRGVEAVSRLRVASALLRDARQRAVAAADLHRCLHEEPQLSGDVDLRMLIAELDARTGRLGLISDGGQHACIYHSSQQRVEWREVPESTSSPESPADAAVVLEPGECVVLCSQGMVDTRNARDEPYGSSRLSAAIAEGASATKASAIVRHALGEVFVFCAGCEQKLDRTIAVLRYEGPVNSG